LLNNSTPLLREKIDNKLHLVRVEFVTIGLKIDILLLKVSHTKGGDIPGKVEHLCYNKIRDRILFHSEWNL
jgi:hypothetical protein